MVKAKKGFIAECKKDEKLISNATAAPEEDVSILFLLKNYVKTVIFRQVLNMNGIKACKD